MTTIFISKMESLPPSSDTKMIDIWLIICQLVPFSEVVLLTAVEYLRADEDAVADNEVGCPFLKTVDIFVFFRLFRLIQRPSLKEYNHSYLPWSSLVWTPYTFVRVCHNQSFLEKKALWAIVVAVFVIYFTLAAKFYLNTQWIFAENLSKTMLKVYFRMALFEFYKVFPTNVFSKALNRFPKNRFNRWSNRIIKIFCQSDLSN